MAGLNKLSSPRNDSASMSLSIETSELRVFESEGHNGALYIDDTEAKLEFQRVEFESIIQELSWKLECSSMTIQKMLKKRNKYQTAIENLENECKELQKENANLKDEFQKLKKQSRNESISKHRTSNSTEGFLSPHILTKRMLSIGIQTDMISHARPEKDPNIGVYVKSLQRLVKTQEEFLEQCNEALSVTKFENSKLHNIIGELEQEKMLLKERTITYPEAPSPKKKLSYSEAQGDTFEFCLEDELAILSQNESIFGWAKDESVTPIENKLYNSNTPLQTKVSELQEDLKHIKEALVNNENLIKQMIDKKPISSDSKVPNLLTSSIKKSFSFVKSTKSNTSRVKSSRFAVRSITDRAYYANFLGLILD